jgi:Ser/Thr protein kinase RdoA (MazF antagonist)
VIDDPDGAAAIIAERFGWGPATSMVVAGDGAMGRIWRLETTSGRYAVKELYWAHEPSSNEAVVARQVSFCERARAAGISAPQNIPAASGRFLVALPEDCGGALVRAYEWIDGRDITPADRGATTWAGRTLAILEGLGVPPGDQQVDPWFYQVPTAEEWAAMVDRSVRSGRPWAEALRRAVPALLELSQYVEHPDPDALVLTHTDFQRQNVLLDESDRRFVLLDWDDAGPMTPNRSLAGALGSWHVRGTEVDADGIRETMRAYRAAGGQAQLTGLTDFASTISGSVNYVYGQAGLSVDRSASPRLRADADARMPSLIHDPELGDVARQVATFTEVVGIAGRC